MICVPLANDNLQDMIKFAKKAIKLDADLIEFRLDYLKEIDIDSINIFKPLTDFSLPMILTLRKESEGGNRPLQEDIRLKILHKLIDLKPSFIDLEFSIDQKRLKDLVNRCHVNGVKVILSYHNFNRTQTIEEIEKLVESMSKIDFDILKIIMMAESIYDNNIAFNLLEKIKNDNIEIVSFCMGRLGVISRILCPFFGSKFTFASLDISTAPGQISIQEMKIIHNLIKKNINKQEKSKGEI